MNSLFMIYKGGEALSSTFKENISSFQMDTDKQVISRLKFIGRIKEGEKINVRGNPFVQPNDITTSFSRTFLRTDNRQNTLNFFQDTIESSFKLLYLYSRSKLKSDQISCYHLINDLRAAKIGIQNSRRTYISDTMYCCKIDTLLENIDARLADLDIPDLPIPSSPTLSPSPSPTVSPLIQSSSSPPVLDPQTLSSASPFQPSSHSSCFRQSETKQNIDSE